MMLLHLILTPSLPFQGKSSPSDIFLLSNDAQVFKICFFRAVFGVCLDEHRIFHLEGGLVPLSLHPAFSSVRGADDFFLIPILFAAGTSVFEGDNSFTCDLVLFGIVASMSGRHTLERKEGRVSFVRWVDEVDACGEWNDDMEVDGLVESTC